ncbi:hypothetical protein C8A01DRAFT_16098 [Parachaetomium inaequale]|uniref:Protein kinase domain-containing protein n=1 Tax=Parachaetomium inaequale TaxID=2588326 RepID=A0AAN6PFI4_9PEZI|nr:hypothetical protein C8A01DRAFT_16098 [Parachaetomium inaequale]
MRSPNLSGTRLALSANPVHQIPRHISELVPRKVAKGQFVSMGAISWVYRITPSIVLKYARDTDAADLEREHAIYDMFELHPPCPFVMQSFYRTPAANFLPSMLTSMDTRLRSNQRLEKRKVLEVLRVEERRLVERWAAELSAAVAWLESLGLVHADLRPPPNILFDDRDHLKLTDFDCVGCIGDLADGNAPPWARLFRDPLTGRGHFGVYGPTTEQFAIGSLLYCVAPGE